MYNSEKNLCNETSLLPRRTKDDNKTNLSAQLKHIQSIASLTDEVLLHEFKKTHDQQMLAQLYLRYTDLVYGVCLKYFKDAEAAKDAVMNIYQELLTKLQTHEVDNFKSWLYVLDKESELKKLEFCIEHLPDEQKQSIQLFYLENKCYNEIVEQLGYEWNKVRSLVQNGRRNLKICMEKNG